jgi:hypothetical protein
VDSAQYRAATGPSSLMLASGFWHSVFKVGKCQPIFASRGDEDMAINLIPAFKRPAKFIPTLRVEDTCSEVPEICITQ